MKDSLAYKILSELVTSYLRLVKKICRYIDKLIRVIKDHYYDKKVGVETSESYFYRFRDNVSLYKDMHIQRPTPYRTLEKIIEYLKVDQGDIFIDLGCGKGRAIFLVAAQKLKKVIGIELDPGLVKIARRNLENVKNNNTPVEIINDDAATFKTKEGTIFFLYNPFGPSTLKKILNNIKESLTLNPRNIRIVYFDPECRYLFDAEDWLTLEKIIDNGEIIIWHNKL